MSASGTIAAYVTEPGPPEAIRDGEVPLPALGSTDVLVSTEALVGDPVDTYVRQRGPLPVSPYIVGRELVGTVVERGSAAGNAFAVGERVWCNSMSTGGRQGSFAREVVAPADRLYRLPDGMSAVDAVAVLHGAATAYLGLFGRTTLRPVATVLVGGAGGSVGGCVTQLAASVGARVIATARPDDFKWSRSIGATEVVDYRDPDLLARIRQLAPDGIDLFWDASGHHDLELATSVLARAARSCSWLTARRARCCRLACSTRETPRSWGSRWGARAPESWPPRPVSSISTSARVPSACASEQRSRWQRRHMRMPWSRPDSGAAGDLVASAVVQQSATGMTKVRWRVADLEQLAAKVRLFRELHAGPEMLVMANAWDAASAQRFEAAGFSAIATSSGGLAQALGYADHEQAPVEEMLASAARIVRSVSLPVTVDFESGYGLPPAEIARRLVEIGAVGLNLEDTDHEAGVLRPAEAQAERLAAVRAEARRLGAELFLNARVDVFLRREGELDTQVAEGTRRARLYREAGADCVYPLGLVDPDAIRAIVQAAGVVNVMLRRDGPLSIQTARAAGARRATYATSLFRDMMTVLNAIATEIRAAVLEQPSSAGAQVEPPMNDASAATGEPGAPLREVLASVDGLRVQLVTIARGQSIPRHRHSEVSDTLVAIEGTVIVDIEGDEAAHRLRPGERLTIPSGTVHRVSGEHGEACRFINLHEGGAYDFIEEDASTKHG